MGYEQFISLVTLTFVASWTPGPNNALVASSGATFGIRRTLPHVTGIGIGFTLLLLSVALGLGAVFQYSPVLREGLRWLGIAILIWLAWKIASSDGQGGSTGRSRPFTFVESCLFQWINPKAWIVSISIASQYVTDAQFLNNAVIVSGVALFWGWTSAFGWTVFGRQMQRILQTPFRLRLFNISMAGLLLLAVLALATSEL
jgi:threonine/homoserine/homoserine lactone efflux protein